MATKKPDRSGGTPNGAPAARPTPKETSSAKIAPEIKATEKPVSEEPRPTRMTKAQLEQHVHSLVAQIAQLKTELEEIPGHEIPWWEKISGSFANDPEFEEAMRPGREWRESVRPKKRSRKAKSSNGHS